MSAESEQIEAPGANAAATLRGLIEAWEKLEVEKQDVVEGQKNVMSQIKGAGFDTKIVRKLIALRKMDPNEREELEQILDLYRHALGM
jgi:uncharacterized protein (UPF0335 family)